MQRYTTSLALVLATLVATGCKQNYNLNTSDGSAGTIADPDPCIEVDPKKVDFGQIQVTVEDPKTEIVTIKNTCDGDLEIHDLSLDDASAPFTIGEVGSVLVPGQSSTDFTVTFDPQTSASWNNQVLIDSNDPKTPTATVKLIGEGIAPIISVDPTEYDFGSPFIGCQLEQPYTISNIGNADLVIDQFEWATGSPDLDFDAGTSVPVTVAPGASVQVYVDYVALDTFSDDGYLTIDSNDPWTPQYLVTSTGTGTKYGDNLDVFEQPLKSDTDIIFVIDNSGSMSEEQTNLAANFSPFVDTLAAADADYQLGVISTDTPNFYCDPILPTDSDPSGEFSTCALIGIMGSGDEQGAEMAYEATQAGKDGSDSGKYAFMRDKATIAFVVVSDEHDSSEADRGKTVNDYADAFWALKDYDTDLVRWHSVIGDVPTPSCSTASEAGTNYDTLSNLTGGVIESVCATDWGASLTAVAEGSISVNDSFELTQNPVPQTIQVKVDGVDTSVGWSYDVSSNSVVFESDYVPAGGSTIEVSYELMPDCEG